MKSVVAGMLAMAAALAFAGGAFAADAPQFKRAWGIHCDFHATPVTRDGVVVSNGNQVVIGARLRAEDIAEICDLLKPDFLQIDCKGHPGWASYPSKLGNAMPYFKGDPLRTWREVTKAKGVPLYMHYSGILDKRYAKLHPEEAILGRDGKRDGSALKANGPYADRLVIPQLCELAGEYGVDGVWIDGDCWGAGCDYDEEEVGKFERTIGVDLQGKAPKSREYPYFHEFCDYFRERYREYLRHVVDTVHGRFPNFRICSNWSYSINRPEDVDADVDFISGDLTSDNAVRSARLAGRINAHSDLPWDLMAWGFVSDHKRSSRHTPKTAVGLMQEAAAVISLGGGFQVYLMQKRDGAPDMPRIREMKPVGEFIREREPYCYGGRMKREVAVLLSARDVYRERGDELFSGGKLGRIGGMLDLLADSGRSVGVALDSDLRRENLGKWPVLVVPELHDTLPEATLADIADWVKGGGKLLLTGNHTCDVFAEAGFPCALNDDMIPRMRGFTMDGGKTVGTVMWSRSLADDSGEMLATAEKAFSENGNWHDPKDEDELASLPFAAVRDFGKGKVFVCGADFGDSYEAAAQYLQAALIGSALDRMYVPLARVTGVSGKVEVSVLEKDGKTFVQLVNLNGDHANFRAYTADSIPPVMDLKLELSLAKKPAAIVLQPAGLELDFGWDGKVASVEVGRVDLHDILEIRE